MLEIRAKYIKVFEEEKGLMVVEHKDYKAHFIDSRETDFDYLVYANDDIRIVKAKDKILS